MRGGEELQEGDELVGVFLLDLEAKTTTSCKFWAFNLFFCLYIRERIFVGGREWVDSIGKWC